MSSSGRHPFSKSLAPKNDFSLPTVLVFPKLLETLGQRLEAVGLGNGCLVNPFLDVGVNRRRLRLACILRLTVRRRTGENTDRQHQRPKEPEFYRYKVIWHDVTSTYLEPLLFSESK